MRINIAMPVFRRPEYAAKALKAIQDHFPKEWELYVSVDRAKDGTINQDVVDIFDGCSHIMSISGTPLGCNGNVFRALSLAFESKPDAVVCIEDDIVVSPDSGSYLQWALSTFQNDERVRSVTLWESISRKWYDHGAACLQAGKFTCWGWMTFAREWEGIKANWTTGDDSTETSWDVILEKYWKDRYEVAPFVSRATNIGEELGTHRGAAEPEFLAREYQGRYFIEESVTVHPPKKVFIVLGAYGDIYMIAKEVPKGSIIATSPEYSSILYELFPELEVYEIEGVDRNSLQTAKEICAYKYPNHQIIIAQQDGMGTEGVKPFRNYQQFQRANAKL